MFMEFFRQHIRLYIPIRLLIFQNYILRFNKIRSRRKSEAFDQVIKKSAYVCKIPSAVTAERGIFRLSEVFK